MPVPGADFVEEKKSSRRKKKSTAKDDPTEGGQSSSAPTPFPAQPGHGPGSSKTQKSASGTSTATIQTPASAIARQATQAPNQSAQASSSSTRPTQSSAPTDTRQARQASSQPGQATLSSKPTNTAGAVTASPVRGSATSNTVSAGVQQAKDSHGGDSLEDVSSNYNDGRQEVVRLTGQPRRPLLAPREPYSAYLATNYFQLKFRPNLKLWQYRITVKPEVRGPKLTQIIKTAFNNGDFRSLKPSIVTDFSAIMLSVIEIPGQYHKFKVSYQSELEIQASADAKEYWIYLVPKDEVDLSSPKTFLNPTETGSSGLHVEQALDIVLGHYRKMSDNIAIVNKRKAFFIDSNNQNLYDSYDLRSPALVALRGYFSSVRMSQSNLLVNINVSHAAFYKTPQSLRTVIEWLESLGSVDRSKISSLLRGLRVSTTHILRVWTIWGYPRDNDGKGYMLHPPKFNPPNATSYTPEQVSFFYDEKPKESSADKIQRLSEEEQEKASKGKLEAHAKPCSCPGKWLTVAQYFATIRGEPISRQDLKLPIVNVGSNKRPTYVPSHLCDIRSGQVSKLKIDKDNIVNFAVRSPHQNADSITNNGLTTLGLKSVSPELQQFGIRVDEHMVRLRGRILPQPTLFYGGGKKAMIRGSSWNLQSFAFQTSKPLENWACLRIYRNKADGSIHEEPYRTKLRDFQEHLKSKGITAKKNDDHGDLDLQRGGYPALEEWFKSSRDDYGVRFLLVVLPKFTTSEIYNHIKKFGDVTQGIHTVCVKPDKFGNARYDDNVALKINLKLGGTNHVLRDNDYGQIFDQTMVVGIDVTHPPPGDDVAPSVAAVVASRDKYLSQWPADLRINKKRQEMVNMLRAMLTTRLEHYKEWNSESLPTNILIYRDGVGEGQYKIVLSEELPKLRDACRSVYGEKYDEGVFPRISLIVVGKRHHTRFYQLGDDKVLLENKGNPKCGTLVDRGITRDCNWDFFLQSHTPIRGTARPAHYFVLLDEIFTNTSKDPGSDLEQFTHNLCYLYGKATTSVSIPPPVYYADKACDRGRRYLSRVFDQSQGRGNAAVREDDVRIHGDIKDTMFYI